MCDLHLIPVPPFVFFLGVIAVTFVFRMDATTVLKTEMLKAETLISNVRRFAVGLGFRMHARRFVTALVFFAADGFAVC